MVDRVIYELYGEKGLAAIKKTGYKVIIKVNLVAPSSGLRDEKGRSIITDPRIVRYVAEKVREIIGFDGNADLKVVDAVFSKDPNPSAKWNLGSFHWARLERTGDNLVNPEDFCYDYNADGILDGKSKATLVNLDSIGEEGRIQYEVKLANGRIVKVAFPKMFRTSEQAHGSNEYCDVLISIPVLKSHGLVGMTGTIKLHYGIRSLYGVYEDLGRFGHDGLYYDETGVHNKHYLYDCLCAQHLIHPNDLIIMDCLTGNRTGPTLPVASIGYSEYSDTPADYILTNAIMASTDSVAIDTVATALAGYQQESIKLLDVAAQNGLGTNDPSRILLTGYSNFKVHRQSLYDKYHPQDKYPFMDGWGGAKVLDSVDAPYEVRVSNSHPRKSKDGLYYIDYEVVPLSEDAKVTLSRVELIVNQKVIKYYTGGNLFKGQFIIDTKELDNIYNGSFSCVIGAWDNIFNFNHSIEMILVP